MEKYVWVYNSNNSQFPGGIFEEFHDAVKWLEKNKLSGTLTKCPLNKGTLDWAKEKGCVNMKAEKLMVKEKDPDFVGGFTTASMEHYHFENGKRD